MNEDSARSPVIIVAGPTASGKSALAVGLAERFNGVVINADSLQIYAELSILTARPDAAMLSRAPHQLYGALSGAERCSVALWRELALAQIATAHSDGLLPIVTGGTGLYLGALTSGLVEVPEVPDSVRVASAEALATLGTPGLHAALEKRDPISAARLSPNDTQRVRRAWEVVEATGRSLPAWQHAGGGTPPPALRFAGVVLLPPREALYEACDGRFAAMLRGGALEEARRFQGFDFEATLPIHKALGLAELTRHLAGEIPLGEAQTLAQNATRHYAKRQMTWLRHRPLMPPEAVAPFNRRMAVETQFSPSLMGEIGSFVLQFL